MTIANEKDISRRLIDAIVGGYCGERKKAIQSLYGASVKFGPVPATAPGKRRNFEDIVKERIRCMIFWRGISTVRMSLDMRHGKQWVGNRVLFDRVTCGLDDAVQICEALGESSFVLFRPYLGGGGGEGALRFIEENPGNVTSHTMRKFYAQKWRWYCSISSGLADSALNYSPAPNPASNASNSASAASAIDSRLETTAGV